MPAIDVNFDGGPARICVEELPPISPPSTIRRPSGRATAATLEAATGRLPALEILNPAAAATRVTAWEARCVAAAVFLAAPQPARRANAASSAIGRLRPTMRTTLTRPD